MEIVKPPFPIEIYDAEFRLAIGCNHTSVEPRRKFKTGTGKPYFRRQCVSCGKAMSMQLPFSEIRAYEGQGNIVRDWDEELFQQYLRKRADYGESIRRRLNAERHRIWWDQYAEYRQTREWQTIRERVFKRDNYTCQVCHTKPAEHAHHLTYARVGRELDSDLLAVCVGCHDKLHAD